MFLYNKSVQSHWTQSALIVIMDGMEILVGRKLFHFKSPQRSNFGLKRVMVNQFLSQNMALVQLQGCIKALLSFGLKTFKWIIFVLILKHLIIFALQRKCHSLAKWCGTLRILQLQKVYTFFIMHKIVNARLVVLLTETFRPWGCMKGVFTR